MEHWRVPYLGLSEVPSGLDDYELTTFFTFSTSERLVINSARKPLHRLALGLQLGFLRMTGRMLDAFDQVPARLWAHLGVQLAIAPPEIGNLRALYLERIRTLGDHQKLAQQTLGFERITEHQRRYLVRWLRETMAGRVERKSLMADLKRWLYEHRILQIHERELARTIVTTQISFESVVIGHLIKTFTLHKMESWSKALPVPRQEDGKPLQTWLWAPPRKQSTVQMSQFFRRIEHLRSMGVADWPEDVNDMTVQYHARRCAARPPSVSMRIKSARRSLEVSCFLRHSLCTASDQLLAMLIRWIRTSVVEAETATSPSFAEAHANLIEFAKTVQTLVNDTDLKDDALRAKLRDLIDATLASKKLSKAARGRTYLINHPRQARAVLAHLVRLPLQAQGQHPVIDALAVLRPLYIAKSNLLLKIPTVHLGNRWQDAFADGDRKKALAAFEWATLLKLRMALRNGSVFLSHSFNFKSQASLLISPEQWKVHRASHYGHLKLSMDPKEVIEPMVEHLKERLEVFGQATADGIVNIDAKGMHLEPVKADPDADRLNELRQALFSGRPLGQLPDILMEVDSAVRFSWILLGREPHTRRELVMVYAAVLAHGTSMSAAEVSRMIPELSADAVRQTMKRLCDERSLRLGSDAALQYMLRFDISKHWGRSNLASADMMSLETERTIWQARADPRRKTASIGVYPHVRDGWGIFYDQPIIAKQRQAGVAIEGMVRQTALEGISLIAVDTHGYTDFAMALGKLLHCDLCPHLADIKHNKLHAPKDYQAPEVVSKNLSDVLKCDLDLNQFEAVYDEFVRVVASVKSGKCSAVQIMTRFGSDARGQSIYEGGLQYGKLLRSIYLIDYFLNPVFRREVRHALNRGESLHTLQRAIHTGKIPAQLSKRFESIAAVSSALSLMCNAVMAWNAKHMQIGLERILELGQEPPPLDLRRIAPTEIERINLRGTFEFNLDQFAERIMPSSASAPDESLLRHVNIR